jgi:hypothetical protein
MKPNQADELVEAKPFQFWLSCVKKRTAVSHCPSEGDTKYVAFLFRGSQSVWERECGFGGLLRSSETGWFKIDSGGIGGCDFQWIIRDNKAGEGS